MKRAARRTYFPSRSLGGHFGERRDTQSRQWSTGLRQLLQIHIHAQIGLRIARLVGKKEWVRCRSSLLAIARLLEMKFRHLRPFGRRPSLRTGKEHPETHHTRMMPFQFSCTHSFRNLFLFIFNDPVSLSGRAETSGSILQQDAEPHIIDALPRGVGDPCREGGIVRAFPPRAAARKDPSVRETVGGPLPHVAVDVA